MKKTLLLFLFALVGLFIISCKKEAKNVPVQVLLTDNPADYDSVNIHIKSIRIKMNSEEAGWTDVRAKDTTVNLLDLKNGVTTLLVNDTIPNGNLKELRFILGEDNYIVVSGTHYQLVAPSAEDAGLKVKIDKHLTETLNTFTLDFDAALSIKEENGGYKLLPVIKLR